MRKQYQRFAGALSLAIVAVQSIALYTQAILPDHYYVVAGETLSINSTLPIKTSSSGGSLPVEAYSSPGNSYNVDLKLPYGIEVKQVQVQVVDREMVVPGGNPFGIKMFTEGVLVVGMSDIASGGTSSNPAKAAGLKVGDIIKSIDGRAVQTNEDVGAIVSSCAGNPLLIDLELLRQRGLLLEEELKQAADTPGRVDYDAVRASREVLLRRAFSRRDAETRGEMEVFLEENRDWLPGYALFMALKEEQGGRPWTLWPEPLRRRERAAVEAARTRLSCEIEYHVFLQMEF